MALKSPRIISAEVTKIRELSPRRIPLNEDINAVSQNERGDTVWYLPGLSTEGAVQVWEGEGDRVGNVSACCSGPGLWAERRRTSRSGGKGVERLKGCPGGGVTDIILLSGQASEEVQ
ncbi:hypothetical protein CDEST_08245 [Colletotrichum destructivum]|uniref:Uncharacterized protein n=1 Tax=Colletotrichum destructivum TaxID=34406 RepID=A0AAX4IJY0_9PEZI|nr:hypothetical protein CDEST_08245 [Colletotrichum destructivum]